MELSVAGRGVKAGEVRRGREEGLGIGSQELPVFEDGPCSGSGVPCGLFV